MKSSLSRIAITLSTLVFTAGAAAAQTPQAATSLPKAVAEIRPASVPIAPAKDASISTGYSASDLNRVGVQTAQPLPLSLSDAVLRALENNNEIEVSRDDVRFQETQVRALLGLYDPVFTIQPTYTHSQSTGSPATNDFRINSNFSQFIERGGGNYQVFFNNFRTESAFAQAQATSGTLSNSSSALYSSALGATYTQPLMRNFRTDSRRHSIIIARRRLEQTDADFRLNASNTITQTQQAYWDFVFAMRNQQNQEANVTLARENLRQIEARIEAGAAAPLERAEIATELANREGDLLLATQQVSISENSLKRFVLRDPLSAEWSLSFVPTDAPTVSLTPLSLESALKDAMDNRFELKRLRLQQEINAADIKFYKNQTKPQVDLNTSFSLNGLSHSGTNAPIDTNLLTNSQDLLLLNSLNTTRAAIGLPAVVNPAVTIPASPTFLFGGFNQSLANIFRTDAPNFSIGMTISFPLRNRTAKANLEGARIQEHQISAQVRGQEENVIVDVRNAVQSVETTRQRVLIARRARENAEIQLAGEQKLYEAGKSTSFLLFQRENALNNAKNAEIRAETDHRKALADLQRATSTAFRENGITIVSPLDKK